MANEPAKTNKSREWIPICTNQVRPFTSIIELLCRISLVPRSKINVVIFENIDTTEALEAGVCSMCDPPTTSNIGIICALLYSTYHYDVCSILH